MIYVLLFIGKYCTSLCMECNVGSIRIILILNKRMASTLQTNYRGNACICNIKFQYFHTQKYLNTRDLKRKIYEELTYLQRFVLHCNHRAPSMCSIQQQNKRMHVLLVILLAVIVFEAIIFRNSGNKYIRFSSFPLLME